MKKLKNYDKAKELYEKVTDSAPHDYRGWWGLVRVENYNFNSRRAFENGLNPHEYEEESYYLKCAMIAASEKTVQKLKTHWNEYLQRYDQYVNQKQIDTLQARIDEIEKQIDESDYIIKKTVSDYSILSVKVVSIVGSCLSVLLILTDHGSLWNILLIAMVCICLDVICYNNMFGIVEIIYKDLYELSAMEKTKISKLRKERSKLTKQINELK